MRIVCFDLSHIFRMHWEACKGKPAEDPVQRAIDFVRVRREGYDVAVIACDAIVDDPNMGLRSATSFRTKIDPPRPDPEEPSERIGYKANRESPGAAFYEQQRRVIDRLHRDGCHIFVGPEVYPGLYAEADDVMGWVAAQYRVRAEEGLGNGDDPESWALQIVSGDSDMAQLIDPMVATSVLSPQAGKVYSEDDIIEKYGVPPARIRQFKALAGDASDEFFPFRGELGPPGPEGKRRRLPGIGQGTAKQLLIAYGDASSAVRAAQVDPPPVSLKPNVVKLLRRGGLEAVEKGLALATLKTDLPFDFEPVMAGPLPTLPADDGPRYTNRSGPVTVTQDTVLVPGTGRVTEAASPAREESRRQAPAEPAPVRSQVAPVAEATAIPMPKAQMPLARVQATTKIIETGGIEPYAFQPRDVADLELIARVAFNSCCYAQFGKIEQVMMCILEAAERGIPLGVALRNAYIVKGKLGWSASVIVGQVKRSNLARVFRIVESEPTYAVLEYQHITDEKPLRFKFTLDEARQAGWLKSGEKGDGKWITNPRTMCRWAAMREVARFHWPEVTSGMHTPDEIRNGVTHDSDIGDDPDAEVAE